MLNNVDSQWKVGYLIATFVITFIGNALVILVVYRSRRNQWTTNHFIISLAIVNLLAPTVYLFFTLYSTFCDQWLFGNVGCKINAFLVHFNALTSIGILCCTSFDRYYLTAYPLTFKLSKTQTKKVILAVWILATTISSPMLFFYEVNSTNCLPEFSERWNAYFCCFSMLFLLPHLTTYAIYFKVCRCIQVRNSSRNTARFVQKVPRTKIKVTKLLIAQVMVYTILWVPYIIYHLMISISVEIDKTSLLIVTYLAYVSSAASPMIYSIFSGDFRRGCMLMFMKYDASIAYRLPAQLERKNKVDVMNFEAGNFPMQRAIAGKQQHCNAAFRRDSDVQPALGMTFFEQPRVAWSSV
jgi:G protein-coupled receptor 19